MLGYGLASVSLVAIESDHEETSLDKCPHEMHDSGDRPQIPPHCETLNCSPRCPRIARLIDWPMKCYSDLDPSSWEPMRKTYGLL
jgi:hypothetical protein